MPPALQNVYTGANGTLTLAAGTGPEGTDAGLVITNEGLATVGRVTNVTVRVDTDLQEYYQIGQRMPTSLHPGNVHISGTIERAHINGGLLYLLLGKGARFEQEKEPYVQPVFNMVVNLTDPAIPTNFTQMTLTGVKLQGFSFNMPDNDFVMSQVTFRALSIGLKEQAAASGGSAGAAAKGTPIEIKFPA